MMLSISALSLFCNAAQDNKTDAKAAQILSKMIEAQGGKKRIQEIKDMVVTGTVEITQMGLDGSLTIYQKEPDKLRSDIEVMGMIITQAYDGKTGWWINPQTGETEEMSEQMATEMKRDALGNDSLLNPEKYGIFYTYDGTETIDGVEHHILTQHHTDGYEATLFISGETYLVSRSKAITLAQTGVEVMIETYHSDYKEIDGTMVAHSLIVYQDGEEYMVTTITDVQYNTGLEDSLFKKD